MRWTRFAGAAFVLAAIVAVGLTPSCATKGTQQTAVANVDPIARGKYLTTVMSCVDCHTPGTFYGAPDTMRRLSGSDLGWVGPWGVVHARNLTPDSATGIGTWTTDQIVTALRTGNTPDGTQLAPIMPWLNFTNLREDDAQAIAAYLKSIPPVTHKNLDRIPPGQKPTGALIFFPPPPAWDAPKAPPGGDASKP